MGSKCLSCPQMSRIEGGNLHALLACKSVSCPWVLQAANQTAMASRTRGIERKVGSMTGRCILAAFKTAMSWVEQLLYQVTRMASHIYLRAAFHSEMS